MTTYKARNQVHTPEGKLLAQNNETISAEALDAAVPGFLDSQWWKDNARNFCIVVPKGYAPLPTVVEIQPPASDDGWGDEEEDDEDSE
ncbi:MAG TPA: hypothetical protein VM537_22700 [Anaerolineae bacterium]|nr:hypothetical protein [Anaerolineae bacterium]